MILQNNSNNNTPPPDYSRSHNVQTKSSANLNVYNAKQNFCQHGNIFSVSMRPQNMHRIITEQKILPKSPKFMIRKKCAFNYV